MKQKLRTTIVFLTGILVATCFFQFVYPPPKDAVAYSSCIRTGLKARLTSGDINLYQEFSVGYEIPSCYADNGYRMTKTYIYDDNMVAITYENPNFNKTSGSGGSSGGGMGPIH